MLSLVLTFFLVKFFSAESDRLLPFAMALLMTVIVCLSRIVLGMHAINQVLVGLCLGSIALLA